MQVEHWDEKWGKPTESNMRRRLEALGYQVTRYDYPPGTYFPPHQHSFDKRDAAVSGVLKINIEDKEFMLSTGDTLEIPAGTTHSAEVVSDDTLVSLDGSKPSLHRQKAIANLSSIFNSRTGDF